MIWTIDTWLLVCANQKQDQTAACRDFLYSVLAEHLAALNQEVLREYENKALTSKSSFAAAWYSKMWSTGRLKPFFKPESGKAVNLRQRLEKNLPKAIHRFDPDDVPFVVLCFRTADKHLISGDVGEGDFSPALTRWLKKEYRICFHDLREAAPYHRARHRCTMERR